MLQPNPERQLTAVERKEIQRPINRRRWLGAIAMGTMLTGSAHWIDVTRNKLEELEAKPSIYVIGEALDPAHSHHAIVGFDGFSRVNANGYLNTLGETIQQYTDGALWSVGYNNAPLSGETIYTPLVELVEEKNIESISIATYSMGDVPGIEVGTDIFTKTPILVDTIAINVGPSNIDSLEQEQKDTYGAAEFIDRVAPSFFYSSLGRRLYELGSNSSVYTRDGFDIGAFIDLNNTITKRIETNTVTTNSFLRSQMYALTNANLEENFKRIAENPMGKPLPVIIYFTSASDGVVDTQEAMEDIRAAAVKYGLPFFTFDIPGARHGQYYESVNEYMEVSQHAAEKIDRWRYYDMFNTRNKLSVTTDADNRPSQSEGQSDQSHNG